jgi:hypothetical protein
MITVDPLPRNGEENLMNTCTYITGLMKLKDGMVTVCTDYSDTIVKVSLNVKGSLDPFLLIQLVRKL